MFADTVPQECSEERISDEKCFPLYMDNKRRCYDKYYRHIATPSQGHPSLALGQEMMTGSSEETQLNKLRFPLPVNCRHFGEYRNAILYWRATVSRFFTSMQFPVPVSESYHRPQKPSIVSGAEMRRFKPELAPPVPANHNKMMDLIINGDIVNPEEEFPVQQHHRNIVKMKDQLTGDKQWQSEMMPAEPNPLFYDTFEEFETAYQRWKLVCNDTQSVRIPNAKEIGEFLHVKPSSDHSHASSYSALTSKHHRLDLSWVDAVKDKRAPDPDILQSIREDIKELDYTISRITCTVFGVEYSSFVEDMKTIGCHQKALDVDYPCYPFSYLEMSVSKRSIDSIVEVVTNYDIPNTQLIFQLMKIEFGQESFIAAMSRKKRNLALRIGSVDLSKMREKITRMCKNVVPLPHMIGHDDIDVNTTVSIGKEIGDVLLERIQLQHVINSLGFVRQVDLLYARMSVLLRWIINTSFGRDLFKEIMKPEKLSNLFDVVSILLALSNEKIAMMKPVRNSEFAVKLSQFHLISSFQKDTRLIKNGDLDEFIREQCYSLSMWLNKHAQQIRESLWDSLLTNEKTDGTRMMEMIAASPTSNLRRIIIGSDFMERANKVSKFERGRRFLLRLVYNDNGFNTAMIFTKCRNLDISNVTPYFLMMIGYMISELQRHLRFYNLIFDTTTLLQLFTEDTNSTSLNILIPVARLCCDSSIAQSYSHTSYKTRLASICSMICDSNMDKVGVLRLLLVFCNVECCALAVSTNSKFIIYLSSALGSQQMTECLLAWDLIGILANFPSVIIPILGVEKFAKALNNMIDDLRNHVVARLMLLLKRMWISPSDEIKDCITHAIEKSAGRIACLERLAPARFEAAPKTIELIGKFIADVLHAGTTSSQIEFGNQLATHLAGNSSKGKKAILKKM